MTIKNTNVIKWGFLASTILFLILITLPVVSSLNLDVSRDGKNVLEKYWSNKWESPLPEPLENQRTYPLSFAFETYKESLHGKARALGVKDAPICEDCHNTPKWSEILPVTDTRSPVNEENIGNTCAKCHGERTKTGKVSEGSMHVKISERSVIGEPFTPKKGLPPGVTLKEKFYFIGPIDMASLINWFFSLLTVIVLGIFVIIIFFDTFRKIGDRRGGGGGMIE